MNELGGTLYHRCIQGFITKIIEEKCTKMTKTETIKRTLDNLFYLIEKGYQQKADLQKILSQPNHIGETVFQAMCFTLKGPPIVDFLLRWNVEINIVKLDFGTCNLVHLPQYNEILLTRKMNPKIIDSSGLSPLNVLRQSSVSISPKMQKMIDMYSNAVYYSTVPQICYPECNKCCKSRMEPFRIGMNENGEYITANDSTRIGQGGFGTVFHGKWHGKDSAFKYLFNKR